MLVLRRLVAGGAAVIAAMSLVACAGGSIATVNGQSISRESFDKKLEASPTSHSVLQQLVMQTLLDQYATRHNITITNAAIAQRESDIEANYPPGSFAQRLAAAGLSQHGFDQIVRQQLIIDAAVGKNVTIPESQIKDFFDKNHAQFDTQEQIRARHILVSDLATAQKIEKLLKEGQHFSALAKQYSIDPGSKDKGGELGFFGATQMVKPFAAYAMTGPIGKISPPIRSPFGYHIIEVEARKPAVKATLASVHDRIKSQLLEQQEQPLIQPFLAGLQAKASIQISDPRFAGLFPSPPPTPAAAATAGTASAAPSPAASTAPTTPPTKK
ncbi:MAG TPA: peptidylprolyl isomerase [Candidatus Dormibacteraeota bacterium]|nr:peptidylprolyl isomerase [Candidatus Dormibacteraeota bacterium]